MKNMSVNDKAGNILQTNDQQNNAGSRNPNVRDLLNPLHFLSLGLGSGLLKPAPGTWGTLAALPVWLLFANTSPVIYGAILLLSSLIGIYLCGYTATAMGTHDHSAIVWDEFVGMWIALFLVPVTVPMTWLGVLIAFLLFRLFDIWKPWPIGFIDKHVHGGFGIMIDDVIAGVFACVLTHVILRLIA